MELTINIFTNHFNNLPTVTSNKLIILVAMFLILFDNFTFFSNVLAIYPLNLNNLVFLFSLLWVFTGFSILMLAIASFKFTVKPVLISILVISSFTSYFMDTYKTIIDTSMIHNTLNTDLAESLDLFSYKLVLYVLFLGILPSYLVYKIPVVASTAWQELKSRLILIVATVLSILLLIYALGDYYGSFFREHKSIRYYSNPGSYIYSSGKYIGDIFKSQDQILKEIGTDARAPVTDPHRELIIFVVGETARADRFSLNGYVRDTNPLLKKEHVISYTDFWSCGTSTAISVPCMFSIYNSADFDIQKGKSTENVLDILQRAGVNVLWLDNNSSSKGVADRIENHSFKEPDINPECDIECRDTGMLTNLQSYIDQHPEGDIFIVLHQMGQHGPAYYKRYPAEFEKFTPVCKTNQLENCTEQELNNAYDNDILYTDYFLSKVISFLKTNDNQYETAMLYVSDHGESLGENGLYLHGLPNFIAPDVQRHVPAILWLGQGMHDIDLTLNAKNKDKRFSHDNLFHTLLGLMEMNSEVYDVSNDMLIHSVEYE